MAQGGDAKGFGGFNPAKVQDNSGAFAPQPLTGGGQGEELVGRFGLAMVQVGADLVVFVTQPRPGGGRGAELVSCVFRGEEDPCLRVPTVPDDVSNLYNSFNARAKETEGAEHAVDVGDGHEYGSFGWLSPHPVAGLMAASAAVMVLAGGTASPAVAFGSFALLLAGLAVVLAHVRRE